ncbi:MAG: hypothetical protein KDB08_11945, partial [Microthrixaceae bacterium]|nr:hypothetical protein [Microthrixaceae bacterium]
GLMQVLFGLRGTVAASPDEFPSIGFAIQRAADARGLVTPRWITPDHGRVTPGTLRGQLDGVDAVVVSLVDYRTGFVADLEGIRQVIGDRLLIVDANQGFGVVEAPYALADVVAAAGAKWPRAGNGTAMLALGPRALERVEPVWSGWNASELPEEEMPMGEVLPPASGARAFQIS